MFVFTELNRVRTRWDFAYARDLARAKHSISINRASCVTSKSFTRHNELTVLGRFRFRASGLECSEVTNAQQRERKRSDRFSAALRVEGESK